MKICSSNILISLTSDVTRQAVFRFFFGRHFLHPEKIPAPHFPFSGHRSKMRFTPKTSHAAIPLVSIKAILGDPRAKINASQLHYLILLLRLITSDKSGRRYPRVSCLNKPAIIGDHVHPVSLARLRCDIGRSSLVSIAQRTAWPWHRLARNLLFYGEARPPAPCPHRPSAPAPNAETPSPHKNCLFVCQYSLLTSLICCSCAKVVC